MGCGGSKGATAVMPSDMPMKPGGLIEPDLVTSQKIPRDTKSGKSNSSSDSGFNDSADDASSNASSPDEVEQPEAREAVISPQVDASGGCAFDIAFDAAPTRKRMPPRLKAIVQAPKREKTMLELDREQRAANQRRSAAVEAQRNKAAQEGAKVDTIAHKLTREKTTLGKVQDDKENKALENRKKHLQEMQKKLRVQEDKAKKVRQAKRASSGTSQKSERALSGKSARPISSRN